MTKNYYLAVWGVGGEIYQKDAAQQRDAAQQYAPFTTQLPSGRFDEGVYRFYSELTRHYPEIEMMTDEEMESSPWACALELGEDHVIMALLEEWYADAFPLILNFGWCPWLGLLRSPNGQSSYTGSSSPEDRGIDQPSVFTAAASSRVLHTPDLENHLV